MTFIAVRWFTARSCTGIVKVQDDECKIKYYIGAVTGLDEEADTQNIMDWGSSFPKDAGDVLFSNG